MSTMAEPTSSRSSARYRVTRSVGRWAKAECGPRVAAMRLFRNGPQPGTPGHRCRSPQPRPQPHSSRHVDRRMTIGIRRPAETGHQRTACGVPPKGVPFGTPTDSLDRKVFSAGRRVSESLPDSMCHEVGVLLGSGTVRGCRSCWATRVSAVEQNVDLQRDALRAADCWKVFTDHVTGTWERRPELDQLIEQLRPGDTVGVSTRSSRCCRQWPGTSAAIPEPTSWLY
ncbi:MAG: recombinase family protein [Pseudonocardiaceae bacterium]